MSSRRISIPEDQLQELLEALKGCSACEYDEAEGELINHCRTCQFTVTQIAWDILSRYVT